MTVICRMLRAIGIVLLINYLYLGFLSIAIAGQHLWNSLLHHLRDSELTSLEFYQLLKMHLFAADA